MAEFFDGSIKSFNESKGYGFIECAKTHQMYGKDMFVLKTDLPDQYAQAGEQVRFEVVHEHNGPVAKGVQFTGSRASPQGYGSPAIARGGYQAAGGMDDPSFVGTVKSFNAEKGWGMIQCPQTHQEFGKDIFFSSQVVPGGVLSVGEQVVFTIKMEAKGPAAATVSSSRRGGGGRGMMVPAPPAMMMVRGGGMMNGGGYGMMGGGMMQPAVAVGKAEQIFFGKVKTWNEEKGYGHVTCDAATRIHGRDVFLLRGQIKEGTPEVGSLLRFQVIPSPKGPQAQSAFILPPDSWKIDSRESASYLGTVKNFNGEKGYGFLEGDDIKQIFGKDIFLHRRELGGGDEMMPTNGDRIHFQVEIDDKGQPVARSAELEGGFGARGNASATRASPY